MKTAVKTDYLFSQMRFPIMFSGAQCCLQKSYRYILNEIQVVTHRLLSSLETVKADKSTVIHSPSDNKAFHETTFPFQPVYCM